MKHFSLGLNIVLGVVVALILLRSNTATDKNELPVNKETTISQNVVDDLGIQDLKPVPIPDNLLFAGERMPLHDLDVKERLDRELLVNTYWHSNTIRNIKLANKYFPIIEPILAKHGVPDDFKYLAVAESGLLNVTSPAGAKGIWQIMKGTAKENGLEVTSEVDERYHIEKATELACRYLKKSYNRFGSWSLAAAAYNAGNSRVSGVMDKQKANSYYDLYLNTETSRYVFRIAAIKLILSNPAAYGFNIPRSEKYFTTAYNVETVKAIDNIPAFAQLKGTTYKQFKLLNPWLRTTQLTASKTGKTYEIKIPL